MILSDLKSKPRPISESKIWSRTVTAATSADTNHKKLILGPLGLSRGSRDRRAHCTHAPEACPQQGVQLYEVVAQDTPFALRYRRRRM
ncbi:hypothetical protein EVAR_54490_1 [Eumeta japonica]|uniref:Uncharacterized protein n=1 Tax=Eumeta variegata TaxID=151549 RepID=A0A4C1YV71_EUMVA|nr:hypothetical protein EVAR_54490_1 [Eumeta japonica]